MQTDFMDAGSRLGRQGDQFRAAAHDFANHPAMRQSHGGL